MRIPRVRFTVRRLMIAVAVLALILGTWGRMLLLSESYRRVYVAESEAARNLYASASGYQLGVADPLRFRKEVEWHMKKSQKYLYAYRHPWLPVAPDPPEPE